MVSTPVTATQSTTTSMTNSTKKVAKTEDVLQNFGQMMNQSLTDMNSKSSRAENVTTASGKKGNTDVTSLADSMRTDSSNRVNAKTTDTTSASGADTTAARTKSTGSTEETDIETVSETTSDNAEGKIRDELKLVLDVTDEEIDAALQTLGFTMLDLLQLDNMTSFVVEITGNEDAMDLLTDSSLSDSLFALQNFAAQISTEIQPEEGVGVQKETEDVDSLMKNTDEKKAADTVVDIDIDTNKDTAKAASTDKASVSENDKVMITDNRTERQKNPSSGQNHEEHQESSLGSRNSEAVINNLAQAVDASVSAQEIDGMSEFDAVSVVNQIVEAAKVTLNDQVSSMELMLNPENLGKVALNVSVKEGVVTAQIVAENQTTKEAIESQVIMLKEQLNNQGLKVEAVEVTIASHSFEAGYDQQQRSFEEQDRREGRKTGVGRIDLSSLDDETFSQLSEEEQLEADIMASEGNLVNFRA